MIADNATFSEAAKKLYIAQPSLAEAMGITIFQRTNKGVLLTKEGEEFPGYARGVMEHMNLIEDVVQLRSEVGVLYLNQFNETVLSCHRLFIAKPHVFVSIFSPLAQKELIALEDLAPYPHLSYE